MTLREEGKERRRQRILDAVVEILTEEGISGLGIAKIAERARVSVATLYNLIGPLDQIVGAMVSRMFKEFEAIRLEPSSSTDPIDGIYRFVDATLEHFEEDPERFRAMHRAIFHLIMAEGFPGPVIRTAVRNQQSLQELLEESMRQDLLRPSANPSRVAEQMLSGQLSLLKAWSIELISLERYRLSCRLTFATLLRAWATPELCPRLDHEIETLEMMLDSAEVPLEESARRALP